MVNSFQRVAASVRTLNIVVDSPAEFVITKTELDIGVICQPYQDIAHCVRTALCISHNLRRWVHLVICFEKIGPMSIHLDPKSIQYMGTDERSILLLLMKGQETLQKRKQRTPRGLRISTSGAEKTLSQLASEESLLLFPGKRSSWERTVCSFKNIVMYCPLSEEPLSQWTDSFSGKHYKDHHRRDLAILEIIHELDLISWTKEK